MAFRIVTSAFQPGGNIPQNFTCEGANKSPILRWEEVPEGTQSFAVIMENPDAPGEPLYHWMVYDIPGSATGLLPALDRVDMLPDGTKQGVNDFGELGYDGPSPAPGQKLQYVFRVFALKEPPGLIPGMRKEELLGKIEERGVLARAEVTAFYKSFAKKKKAVA